MERRVHIIWHLAAYVPRGSIKTTYLPYVDSSSLQNTNSQ